MDKLLVHPFRHSLRCASRQWRGSSILHARFNATVSEAAQKKLTWPEYLAIRRGKRKWEIVSLYPIALKPSKKMAQNLREGFYDSLCHSGVLRGSDILWVLGNRHHETDHGTNLPPAELVAFSYHRLNQGFDPLIVYGGCTLACLGALPWLNPTHSKVSIGLNFF
jgi:hypothetical protein